MPRGSAPLAPFPNQAHDLLTDRGARRGPIVLSQDLLQLADGEAGAGEDAAGAQKPVCSAAVGKLSLGRVFIFPVTNGKRVRRKNKGRDTPMNPTLHHVNLKTTRLKQMIDWYGAVAGMKPMHVAPVGAWLSNDAANHRLALIAFPGMSDDADKDSHTGIHHMAFEFSSLAELFANFARLRELGIRPVVCLDHGLTTSMYYADPDRNAVELQTDNFHDWAKSSDYIRTSPEFAANPIGAPFDPDRAYEAFRGGKSHEDLHRAMMAGQFLPDALPPPLGLPPGTSLAPPQA